MPLSMIVYCSEKSLGICSSVQLVVSFSTRLVLTDQEKNITKSIMPLFIDVGITKLICIARKLDRREMA